MVQYLNALVASFMVRDEEGQGLVEYGLIIALIAVVCAIAVGTLGTTVNGIFGTINGAFS